MLAKILLNTNWLIFELLNIGDVVNMLKLNKNIFYLAKKYIDKFLAFQDILRYDIILFKLNRKHYLDDSEFMLHRVIRKGCSLDVLKFILNKICLLEQVKTCKSKTMCLQHTACRGKVANHTCSASCNAKLGCTKHSVCGLPINEKLYFAVILGNNMKCIIWLFLKLNPKKVVSDCIMNAALYVGNKECIFFLKQYFKFTKQSMSWAMMSDNFDKKYVELLKGIGCQDQYGL